MFCFILYSILWTAMGEQNFFRKWSLQRNDHVKTCWKHLKYNLIENYGKFTRLYFAAIHIRSKARLERKICLGAKNGNPTAYSFHSFHISLGKYFFSSLYFTLMWRGARGEKIISLWGRSRVGNSLFCSFALSLLSLFTKRAMYANCSCFSLL